VSDDRYRGVVFNPADLAEDVDLDLAQRKRILHAESLCVDGTLWDALGLRWNAPPEAVRAAYIDAAKVFHPDRYAGKRLGSYRSRLERVFRRVTEARDTLCDEHRRATYARETAPATEFTKAEARKLEDERRSTERRARLARQNPLVARASRVADLVSRGRQAMQAGNYVQAANDLLLAQSMDPSNVDLGTLAAEAKRRGATQRASEHFDKGQASQVMGTHASAVASYRAALEADPRHARAAVAGVRAALAANDLAAARELAHAGVRAAPGMGQVHEAMGLMLEAAGEKKEARKAFERAVELDPKLELAKERIRKLRWGILG
jgi:curved DNA-binding protein CbpA